MDDATDDVKQWLIRSQRDLKVAAVLLKSQESLFDAVVYHCQQAAEKALKAYLTYQRVSFRKTHDLGLLVELCLVSEPRFQCLEDVADVLTPYATEFRYPGNIIEPERHEAEEALRMAASVVNLVTEALPDELSNPG
jgi:HEPN domain-containing protein